MVISTFPAMDSTKQSIIKEQKRLVFAGENTGIDHDSAYLAAEWQESLDLGIDPHMSKLGDDALDASTLSNISTYLKTYKTYFSDFFQYQSSLLAAHGCCIFYTDHNGSVYSKDGDKTLLARLKDHGIKFSTNFSKSNIGVNAVTIAQNAEGIIVRRFGEENFLDILSPYVVYARTLKRKKEMPTNTVMMIVPVEKYDSSVEELIFHFYELEELISSKLTGTYEDSRMKLMKLSSIVGEDEIILCDTSGKIVYVNETLESFSGIPGEFCHNRQLSDVFPSLAFCMRSLKSGQNLPLHETYLRDRHGDSVSYYAECFVVRDKGSIEGIKIILRKVSNIRRYTNELSKHATARYCFEDMVGESAVFKQVINMAHRAANGSSNILIFGESGTGKELLAHSIHNASARRVKPFIPLNCAAIPKDLISSELFGYDDGAFTGARKGGYVGKLEQANGGTLFLDEIGEMPYDMQATLLRFLEDGVVFRLGGRKPLPVDVRIISATNKNLAEYVEQGKFRLDLYYRLNVVKLTLPPLRDRIGDIPLLVQAMLNNMFNELGVSRISLSDEVLALFQSYSWPGNLRELRNILECCINIADGVITLDQLPPDMFRTLSEGGKRIDLPFEQTSHDQEKPLSTANPCAVYNEYETNMISELMIKYAGNKSAVAKELGVARSTLYRKLKNM